MLKPGVVTCFSDWESRSFSRHDNWMGSAKDFVLFAGRKKKKKRGETIMRRLQALLACLRNVETPCQMRRGLRSANNSKNLQEISTQSVFVGPGCVRLWVTVRKNNNKANVQITALGKTFVSLKQIVVTPTPPLLPPPPPMCVRDACALKAKVRFRQCELSGINSVVQARHGAVKHGNCSFSGREDGKDGE